MDPIIIPIVLGGIMPVVIVFINFFYGNKTAANKMNLLAKAIESGVDIDPTVLMESLESKKEKNTTIKERLINKLVSGIILFLLGIASFICLAVRILSAKWCIYVGIAGVAVGAAFIVAYFVGRKLLASEIEAETRKLTENSVNKFNL